MFNNSEKDMRMADDGVLETKSVLCIGSKLKHLRKSQDLTLIKLSQFIGMSPSLISQIENDKVSPPIATLYKIASYFKVDLSYFFLSNDGNNTIDENDVVCTKLKDIKTSKAVIEDEGKEPIYIYKSLGENKKNQVMSPFLYIIKPGGKNYPLYSHSGEQFVYVLDGEVKVVVNGAEYCLEVGDAILYNASLTHRIINDSNKEATILTVITTTKK